jgi:hypothetical protein
MTSFKDTYEYCERFVQEELKRKIMSSADIERNIQCSEDEEGLIVLMSEIGNLYKHLENIQNMKTSYISGR